MWKKNGDIYDGDWEAGLRSGFGMLSVRDGDEHVKRYSGGWKNDMRHVRTLQLTFQCINILLKFLP